MVEDQALNETTRVISHRPTPHTMASFSCLYRQGGASAFRDDRQLGKKNETPEQKNPGAVRVYSSLSLRHRRLADVLGALERRAIPSLRLPDAVETEADKEGGGGLGSEPGVDIGSEEAQRRKRMDEEADRDLVVQLMDEFEEETNDHANDDEDEGGDGGGGKSVQTLVSRRRRRARALIARAQKHAEAHPTHRALRILLIVDRFERLRMPCNYIAVAMLYEKPREMVEFIERHCVPDYRQPDEHAFPFFTIKVTDTRVRVRAASKLVARAKRSIDESSRVTEGREALVRISKYARRLLDENGVTDAYASVPLDVLLHTKKSSLLRISAGHTDLDASSPSKVRKKQRK